MISAWRKDEMRTKLKAVKKLVDDAEKEKKNAMMQQGSWFRGCYLVMWHWCRICKASLFLSSNTYRSTLPDWQSIIRNPREISAESCNHFKDG